MSRPCREGHRRVVGATKSVLEPVARGQADGADAIVIDRAERRAELVVLHKVAEAHGDSERQALALRHDRHDAAVNLGRLGRGVVVDKPSVVARSRVAVERRGAEPKAIDAQRCIVGQSAKAELARVIGNGRQVERQAVAGQQI